MGSRRCHEWKRILADVRITRKTDFEQDVRLIELPLSLMNGFLNLFVSLVFILLSTSLDFDFLCFDFEEVLKNANDTKIRKLGNKKGELKDCEVTKLKNSETAKFKDSENEHFKL